MAARWLALWLGAATTVACSSYVVVRSPADVAPTLARPHVNAVRLSARGAPARPRDAAARIAAELPPQPLDVRAAVSAADAQGSAARCAAAIDRRIPALPPSARPAVASLVRLFGAHALPALARPALARARGRERATLALRWQSWGAWGEGPRCSRFHEDHVELRMVCALVGEGTPVLAERPGRRAAMGLGAALQLDADVANALVCAPWEAEHAVPQGDVLFLKGRRWRDGRDAAARGGARQRAAIHRSPAPTGVARALLTLDYEYCE